ncbi:MAG: hypothetical protein MI919_25545, partial [Holophagales bacterium]|nr:hypothetical protein [Holophagales bacterium]
MAAEVIAAWERADPGAVPSAVKGYGLRFPPYPVDTPSLHRLPEDLPMLAARNTPRPSPFPAFPTALARGFCWLFAGVLSAVAAEAAEPPGSSGLGPGPRLGFLEIRAPEGDGVSYSLNTRERGVWLEPGALTLALEAEESTSLVRVRLLGARAGVELRAADPLPGRVQMYRGNDPGRWSSGARMYATVTQKGLYPGIDHVFEVRPDGLKGEYRLEPGADPARIRLRYEGAEALRVNRQGELEIETASGIWRESAPVAFQPLDGEPWEGDRRSVEARFVLRGVGDKVGEVSFELGAYDPDLPLVIDPLLYFSTYLGGSEGDSGADLALDSQGSLWIGGTTLSSNLPAVNAHQAANAGDRDFFLAKLTPDGNTLLVLTYLGGTRRELFAELTVDPEDNVHGTGWTTSTDFPTTPGVLGPGPFGVGSTSDDVVVVKLDPSGTLAHATYLGAAGDDQVQDIAVDPLGRIVIVGGSFSAGFPTSPGAYQTSLVGSWDAFVTRLDPAVSAIQCSTFLGGSAFDHAFDVALDPVGRIYVVGTSESNDFPTTVGAYDETCDPPSTMWLARIDGNCSLLGYSTCIDETVA